MPSTMRTISTFTTLAALASLVTAWPQPREHNEKRADCPATPAVIYVAGTQNTGPVSEYSPYPTPTDGNLENIISAGIPSATATPLPYPCTGLSGDFDNYLQSWSDGVVALQNQITGYLDSCSGGSVVLVGYSQGASIISSALGGFSAGVNQGVATIPALDSSYADSILGGVLFADPNFVVGTNPLDYTGDGVSGGLSSNTATNGAFQSANTQSNFNSNYNGKFQSYCETGDLYCANAANGGSIHGAEVTYWESTAINFLQSKNF